MNAYINELLQFTLIHCTDDELNHLGEVAAAELATIRDQQAVEQLRLDCEN